jgi:hypothetical protein
VTDSECFRSAAAVRGYAVAGHSGPHGLCKRVSTTVENPARTRRRLWCVTRRWPLRKLGHDARIHSWG